MPVNIISLGISAPSCRKWEKKQTAKSYVEYQRLRLMQTGKLQTATMRIQLQKSGKTAVIVTMAGNLEVPAQNVLDNLAALLEIGRSLPIMCEAEKSSFSYSGNLPAYGIPEKSNAEKYAERLREDKWDVRKFGDPSEWRLVRV
jgi:hypothetical protein